MASRYPEYDQSFVGVDVKYFSPAINDSLYCDDDIVTVLSVKVNSNYYRGGLKYLSTFLYSCDNFGDIIALWPVNDSAAKKYIAVTHLLLLWTSIYLHIS